MNRLFKGGIKLLQYQLTNYKYAVVFLTPTDHNEALTIVSTKRQDDSKIDTSQKAILTSLMGLGRDNASQTPLGSKKANDSISRISKDESPNVMVFEEELVNVSIDNISFESRSVGEHVETERIRSNK